ncbi:E3 ubiquitin-protein ligase rnf8-B-like isoform X2 [Galleria mellonella]|uniref:E3 ubiquitin-protein ligase CHFR n=1 Tax=Galleria mellonella TaxID=7137 RepID=A0A6J1WFM4_GALME|nr:E3 ubiquitin-protein ligase rnf8-B-like isoform X2 [Galleria mellonella]
MIRIWNITKSLFFTFIRKIYYNMDKNVPLLIACKPLKSEFNNFQEISLTSSEFTLGRGLQNSVVIPFLAISRNHCTFRKIGNSEWIIEDNSTFGLLINGQKLGKGNIKKLSNEDVIILEPSEEFKYRFIFESDTNIIPRKRIKLEVDDETNNFINDVKIKFEESQSCEIKHLEDKIQNRKQMQTATMILKQQLQINMDRKIKHLESQYALQIENLKGEKSEVEQQKALRIAERDAQLAMVKEEMEMKILELMDQIKKHNEAESEMIKENNSLKEKLLKEREEFLSELNRKNTSKEEMLKKLTAKMKEQEEVRLKEKQELEEMLRTETEQLRLAKEKELKELEKQKELREIELKQELDEIKKNLEEKVQQTEQQKLNAEQYLNEQMEQMKKLNDEEKVKMDQLIQEREEIRKKLAEAQINSEKSLEELKSRVTQRETELAALAAERIQKQAEQSSEVISSLQDQLEKMRKQLEIVETENKNLIESVPDPFKEGTSKQSTLAEVGQLMESELQCSICAELFINAITLNCSHTFCKYCITAWKRKKKDCPICRAAITSECKSLVIDSFIEKMVLNLTEEMKNKRQELLKNREAEITAMDTRTTAISSSSRRGRRRRNTRTTTTTSTSGHFHEDGTMSRQIPTVDLTMLPIPRSPPQIFLLPAPMVVQTNLEVQTTDTVTMPSQVYLVPTTEGTDGATVAAPMVTGHQVAPSDNLIN